MQFKANLNRFFGRAIIRRRSIRSALLGAALLGSAFLFSPIHSATFGPLGSDPITVPGAEWGASYNGPANCCESAPKMVVAPTGNLYLTGKSTTTREEPSGPFNDDIVTIKYDSLGVELWARRFDGQAHSTDTPTDIAIDDKGNAYVTGYTLSEYDSRYVTLKYDSDGNLLWARETETEPYNYAAAVDVDAQGNVYVTGRSAFELDAYNNPIFRYLTIKYDQSGTEQWRRYFESPQQKGAQAVDVKADTNGNVYVTGKVYLPLEPLEQGFNVFTIKYDSLGNQLWVREFSGTGPHYYNDDTPTKLLLDNQGNPSVLGSSTRSPDQHDVLVLRYSPDGDVIQTFLSNHQDDELGTELVFDSAGNLYVQALKLIRIEYSLRFDEVTMKIDPAGTVLWRKLFPNASNGNDVGRGIVITSGGDVYAGIDSQQGTTFNQNYVLVKYNPADGTIQNQRAFDSPAHLMDKLSGIGIDAADNIYLTGETEADWESHRVVDFLTLKISSGKRTKSKR